MKKLSTHQAGLAPLLILLIVVILAAIGGIGWYVYSRDSDEPGSAETTEVDVSEEVSDASFSGSYFDAIDRGEPLECTWKAADEAGGQFQVGEGTFYTDGENRGYSEATFQTEDIATTAYAIFDADYVYSWSTIPGVGTFGTKIARTGLEASGEDLTAEEQQQAIDVRASYSFDCESWTVDESILTPPADVTFQEIAL